MGIFGFNFNKNKKLQAEINQLKAAKLVDPPSILYNNSLPIYGSSNAKNNIDRGYLGSGDFYSIVRKIAKTAATIPFYVYRVKDENALKEYDFATKQFNYTTAGLVRKELLKTKALELVGEKNELQILLDNPNQIYDKTEFREGAYIFRLVTGNTYIHLPILEEGVNAGKISEMYLMPSQYTFPVVQRTFPASITSYQMNMFSILNFKPEEVLHIRYFNPAFDNSGNELVGLSPLRAGNKILTKQQSETDYSVNAFQNSGADVLVTREDYEDARDPAFGQMKSDYYAETTGVGNARKAFFTAGKYAVHRMGLSPVDMDLLKSESVTFKKLCNLFGISDVLFNNDSSSTESNVKEMIGQLYTNAALPEVYALRDALNAKVTPMFNKKGEKYFIDCDITGITELQDDMKQMAEIFSTLPMMKPNLILDAFNYGKSTDPNMDKWYIKTGYVELDSLEAIPEIQPVTANGN